MSAAGRCCGKVGGFFGGDVCGDVCGAGKMSRPELRVSLPPVAGPFGRKRDLHGPVPIVGAVRAVRLGCVKSWAWQQWAENEAQVWALDAPYSMPAGSMRSARAGGYWVPSVVLGGRS